MHKRLLLLLITIFSQLAMAETVSIEITVPSIHEVPYHRPYMAVWVETSEREGIHTIAVWHEKKKWLKDLRQWWRKLGRENSAQYDAVTKATPKPGHYTLQWDTKTLADVQLAKGAYYLCIEAAREDGGRDFIKQKILLGSAQPQTYTLQAKTEIGPINIKIK